MSGEVTLDIALRLCTLFFTIVHGAANNDAERVESSSIKERAEGLKDLRHVLRNNSKFDTLSDLAFHRIYEVLFGVALAEKSALLKSKTATTRSAAENRLSSCASALRLSVEVGVRYVRAKTVRSVLDHVIETIILPNAQFCEPIALDYVKCLRAVLAFQPHVEHLSRDDRERVASFCVECIQIVRVEFADEDAVQAAAPVSTATAANGVSHLSSRSRINRFVDSQPSRSLAKSMAEEVVACLSLLTATPNADPGAGAAERLAAVAALLQVGSLSGSFRQDAFTTMNNILAWTRTEDTALTRQMAGPLISLIRNYWGAKTSFDKALASFRSEMLITLIHIQPFIFIAVYRDMERTLAAELHALVEVMKDEYTRRAERDQLRMDDIRLELSKPEFASPGDIRTALFTLRSGKTQAESTWTTVYIIANFTNALLGSKVEEITSDDEFDIVTERPRKRQRRSEDLDDALSASTGGLTTIRVCALQTIAFLAQQRAFGLNQLVKIIEGLAISCTDENGMVASWAIVALASAAWQTQSTAESLTGRWRSIWQIMTRALSNISTCRAACYLIVVMIRTSLATPQMSIELLQSMTSSMDLNGPSVLADSVLALLQVAVEGAQRINPGSSNGAAENILNWLCRNFRPSRLFDRDYPSQSQHAEPQDIIALMNACVGQVGHVDYSPRYPVWETVGQAWVDSANQSLLLDYLLLVPIPAEYTHGNMNQIPTPPSVQSRPSCEGILLNFLVGETHTLLERWTELNREKAHNISTDMFANYCNTCLIVACITFCNDFRDTRRQCQLQSCVQDILRTVCDFVPSQNCSQDKVDAMLVVFSSICGGRFHAKRQFQHSACELPLCRTISKAILARSTLRYGTAIEHEEDEEMDIVTTNGSQDTTRSVSPAEFQALKSEAAAKYSNVALRANVVTYATTLSYLNQSGASAEHGEQSCSGAIVDFALSLPETTFILSERVISSLSDIGIELTVDDCYRLFDHCADRILWPYVYERNEVALISVLDMMSSFAAVLTDEKNKLLYDLGVDMYNWFAAVALNAGVLSPAVQEKVASLLLRICRVDTDYGRDDERDIPSVRTSLFKLVELGSVRVKFNLANRISAMFDLFVLSNHPAMFDDLQMSLPDDVESIEGMAMRLLFLGKLASAWHSLLRQCVYYIFETAGRVKSADKHAARSMAELSDVLRFDTPQRLFRLFAPQLLHTWLQRSRITSLPFAVFDYDTLQSLIIQNQGEITAQIIIRGNEGALQVVLDSTKMSSKELVSRNFARCEAYCLAWDIANSSGGSNDATSESRLRKLMESKEEHKTFATSHFAAIVGHLFLSLQQDDVQDSWLDKRPGYTAAAKAMSEMRAFSHSDRTLPMSQEPSFKNKYLCDEIERLCRRTGFDPASPWESSSFALAVRMLLDSMEDALGPLHTCLVIRKLRLLICMSGDVAFAGFPLEMLVHTLRPFLADSQCADDVIGILQYLFHHGKDYLGKNIPFLTGTVTLMILQMRKHSGSKPDSTTQESQHKATVQRMQQFQTWLVDLLKICRPLAHVHDLASIASTLTLISLPGNARRGSPESTLLLYLLEPDAAKKDDVRELDRREALMLLSEDFEAPSTIADDCLGYDADYARYIQPLFDLLQVAGSSDTFRDWVASALGRAYACTGVRPVMHEGAEELPLDRHRRRFEDTATSQKSIARRLYELLYSRDRAEASLADYTLRSIFTTFKNHEDMTAFQQMLPGAVVEALSGGTHGYEPAYVSNMPVQTIPLRILLEPKSDMSLDTWAKSLSLAFCQCASEMAIFPALTVALQNSTRMALDFLPCIIHMLLLIEFDEQPTIRTQLSASMAAHFRDEDAAHLPKQKLFVDLLLYLREQPFPGELTHADRLRWLEVDWLVAAQAAQRCKMPTAALMFTESASSPSPQSSRRSSSRASLTQISITQVPQNLLLAVFKDVEEVDSFYGVEQPASLHSVLDRLDYEADGYKSLMFRTAQRDTKLRNNQDPSLADNSGMLRSLSILNLNSLTFALLKSGLDSTGDGTNLMNTARELQRWDIVAPPHNDLTATPNSFKAFQELSRAIDRQTAQESLRKLVHAHIVPLGERGQPSKLSHEWLGTLASLTEVGEVVACNGGEALSFQWNEMQRRQRWMSKGRYEDYQSLLSNRQTMFSVLSKKQSFLTQMHLTVNECRTYEIKALLDVSRFARQHGQLQQALAATTQCNSLLEDSKRAFNEEIAAKVETASVLWNMGEVAASNSMLQVASDLSSIEGQDVPDGRPGLLAQLAHQMASARLEKPDEILNKYLRPAIAQLSGRSAGQEAGKVYHEFATFCDKQLQNPNNIEDFNRIAKLRQRKLEEYEGLVKLSRSSIRADKEYAHRSLEKAKKWYDIDDEDYERLKRSRDTFMEQSVQNYLLALTSSDDYDIAVLRFFALWLEHADVASANKIVGKLLPHVPSWKFVVLMNQLMSRIELGDSVFQTSLKALIARMCSEHPYHTLHHLFAATRKPNGRDEAAISRYNVANGIRQRLKQRSTTGDLLERVFMADRHYQALASRELDGHPNQKILVKEVPEAYSMVKRIPTLHVPPATTGIRLQPDGDYSNLPEITAFGSTVSLMSGLSRPKKVTAIASDGKHYTQLFKGPPGKDDLRQDAIMEQVFGEVSQMLKNHEATRQRHLHVRTYKVIPLSTTTGIIEFVPNSISLTEFLTAAHERYYPSDMKLKLARDKMQTAQNHSAETKIKEFQKVCDHVHPVLRHFFFERFKDPDEWFEKRTAYTRTTATISMLGYVLGLGDRHCQNIMLDERSGEVVHIDLGVAFEAGRVLPVPELVPFRLTRDVVDGMGITKTEGVFRRCCEFTLDALREDKDSIMTILNVLRYDPLYTWTVSPIRAKRIQEATGRTTDGTEVTDGSMKKKEQDAGEADRALSVVEKKLSTTLSTAATVNELIQQATDVGNLAKIFHGWTAWF